LGALEAQLRKGRVQSYPRRLWALVFGVPATSVGALCLAGMLVAHEDLDGLPTARVRRGDVAIAIDEPGRVALSGGRIETQIGAADSMRIRPESRVEIRLPTAPGVVVEGRVANVASVAREKLGATGVPTGIEIFDVIVEPVAEDARLPAGEPIGVRFLVSEHHAALYVPIAGVFLDELERPTVYLRTGRWAEARPVELVASDDRVAVLASGVEEGDEILIALPQAE
jgi:hypothetical protein